MMEMLVSNWYLFIVLIAVICVIGVACYKFLKMPTQSQISAVKQWLLYAVIEAEKELGGGTGQLKLRKVYDMALARFPFLALVSFETFSLWVDESLDQMKELLQNEKIATYVENL